MVNCYQRRLDRVEAEVLRPSGGSVLVVRADVGDDDEAIELKVAEQRQAHGLRSDDEFVRVLVVSWVDRLVQ